MRISDWSSDVCSSDLEIGKPYAEALGEVREIVDTCDFFLGEGRRLYGQTVPSEMPNKQLYTFRNPVGTVAVLTAGNLPVRSVESRVGKECVRPRRSRRTPDH